MDAKEDSVGFVLGALLVGIAWLYFGGSSYSSALNECAKANNVYRCEMVAVPKKGEMK